MCLLRLLDLALRPLVYRERWYKKQLCQNQIEGVIGNEIHFINVIKIQGRNFAPVRVSRRSKAAPENCIVLILRVGSQILGLTIHFPVCFVYSEIPNNIVISINCMRSYAMCFRYLSSSDISFPNSYFSCFNLLVFI